MKKRPKFHKRKHYQIDRVHDMHSLGSASSRICTLRVKSLEPTVAHRISCLLQYLAAHDCFDLLHLTHDRRASVMTACIVGGPYVPAILRARVAAVFGADMLVMATSEEHLLRA